MQIRRLLVAGCAFVGTLTLAPRLAVGQGLDEAEAILEFLRGGAKPVATAETSSEPVVLAQLASADDSFPLPAVDGGAELFARQCAACHGKAGKGDGPAAVALNPRPADGPLAPYRCPRQIAWNGTRESPRSCRNDHTAHRSRRLTRRP